MALPSALSSLSSLPLLELAPNSIFNLHSDSSAGVDVILQITTLPVPSGSAGDYNFSSFLPDTFAKVGGGVNWSSELGSLVNYDTYDSNGNLVGDWQGVTSTYAPVFSLDGGTYFVHLHTSLSSIDVLTYDDAMNSSSSSVFNSYLSQTISSFSTASVVPPIVDDYLEVQSSYRLTASDLSNVKLSVSDLDYSLTGDARSNKILGNDGYNRLSGLVGDDTIDGGIGDDTIDGGLGNDVLIGGSGFDSLIGGDGNDEINAGDGRNNVLGGKGADSINSGLSNDTIDGGDDADTINAGDGLNTVTGGKGADYILTGLNNDKIDGGDDNDIINAGDGLNTVTGGKGLDFITTGSGNDKIDGGDDSDNINAGDGLNTVTGGKGLDFITTGSGNDKIDGGDDSDNINAGDGLNTVTGGNGDDVITSGVANDKIDGGLGLDRLIAGIGNDTLTGGADADTFVLSLVGGVDTVTDFKSGIDKLVFTDSLTPVSLDSSHFVTATTSVFTFTTENSYGYNAKTGELFYDADGSGVGDQVQIALIANKSVLVVSDILVS